jgi:hypothetical protein
MPEMQIVQMLAENTNILYSPIRQLDAFRENKVPNFRGMGNNSIHSIIRDKRAARKVEHTKMVQGPWDH